MGKLTEILTLAQQRGQALGLPYAGALTPQERNVVHQLGLPGISFEPEQRRVYPLGTSAAHIIGFSDAGETGPPRISPEPRPDIAAARLITAASCQ